MAPSVRIPPFPVAFLGPILEPEVSSRIGGQSILGRDTVAYTPNTVGRVHPGFGHARKPRFLPHMDDAPARSGRFEPIGAKVSRAAPVDMGRRWLDRRSYRRFLTATVLVPMWASMPLPSTNIALRDPTLFAM